MTIKPTKKTAAVVLVCLAALSGLLFMRSADVSADTETTYRKLKLLAQVLETIQEKYVERPDPENLIYGAIKGMVSSLDPHSAFLTPEEYKELQIETAGRFTGIGIEITNRDGILTVVSPIEGTPAFKAGIEAGDKIIKVDGKLTKQMTLMDAVKAIRGPRGEKVTLTILRKNSKELIDFDIIRDVIPLISVRSRVLEPGYGYLRIASFQSATGRDLKKELAKLEGGDKPLQGLVLDLRNNPGGLLNQAVEVSDMWIDDGLIVYTEGRVSSQNMKFYASQGDTQRDYPMVVLINQGSASASEIVAGALRDHKRALILGEQSFGKGSVQTIFPFDDKSGLRLTTARYYTPNGTSIQAKGIEPDVVVERIVPPAAPKKKNDLRMREKDLDNHIVDKKNEAETEETAKTEAADLLAKDNQLREALSLLKAWGVFSQSN